MRVAAAIAATLAFAALPVIVLAHAELVTSDPIAGGTLTTTPYPLTATFDDELTPDGSSIVVQDAGGAQVATGSVSPGDAHVLIAELPALPGGEYTVRWTAVTADDAAVERGTYSFTVGGASASVTTSATPSATPSGTPAATPPPAPGATGSSNDVLIAIGLAAAIIGAVVAFIFIRGRR
jgi:methionine-rich copper-binding protein CopC